MSRGGFVVQIFFFLPENKWPTQQFKKIEAAADDDPEAKNKIKINWCHYHQLSYIQRTDLYYFTLVGID